MGRLTRVNSHTSVYECTGRIEELSRSCHVTCVCSPVMTSRTLPPLSPPSSSSSSSAGGRCLPSFISDRMDRRLQQTHALRYPRAWLQSSTPQGRGLKHPPLPQGMAPVINTPGERIETPSVIPRHGSSHQHPRGED